MGGAEIQGVREAWHARVYWCKAKLELLTSYRESFTLRDLPQSALLILPKPNGLGLATRD